MEEEAGWAQGLLSEVEAMELQELMEQLAMVASSPTARIAPLVVLAVATEQAPARCRMSGAGKEGTSKRPHTSMLDVEEISMWCGEEGISHASSRRAVF